MCVCMYVCVCVCVCACVCLSVCLCAWDVLYYFVLFCFDSINFIDLLIRFVG
jgi:hypothetical protein